MRHPIVLGIDEQEINQGTYIHNGVLHGLSKKLNADDIKTLSLAKIGKFVATKAPFISSVREYRLTDLKGIHCSNVLTEFISITVSSKHCTESLKSVIKFANSCDNCLKSEFDCYYDKLEEHCLHCAAAGFTCVSLNVFHVLWDMGSSHKKTSKEIDQITEISTDAEYGSSYLFSIGFGGLHLGKAITNTSRNFSLSHKQQSYGIHVLRALRNIEGPHTAHLANVKAAVYVGKDRQSDYLASMMSSKSIQEALKVAKVYTATRVPELVISHTENAKQQKKIVMPTGLVCNDNGDCFILDSGASCIHVVDRSSVAKVYVIGKYLNPADDICTMNTSMKTSALNFSKHLTDITLINNDVYIVDCGRQAIAIMRNCNLAKKVSKCSADIVCKKNIVSMCGFANKYACICRKSGDSDYIEIFKLQISNVNTSLGNLVAKNSSEI